jgi:ubiquinone biosynthesis protein
MDEIGEIIEELVSKEAILEEAAWLGRDSLNSLRVLPRHIRWFLKNSRKETILTKFKPRKYQSISIKLIVV